METPLETPDNKDYNTNEKEIIQTPKTDFQPMTFYKDYNTRVKENIQKSIEHITKKTDFQPMTFYDLIAKTEIKAITQIFPQALSTKFGIYNLQELLDNISNFQNETKTDKQTLFESKLSNLDKKCLTQQATLFNEQHTHMGKYLIYLKNIFIFNNTRAFTNDYIIHTKNETLYWLNHFNYRDTRYPEPYPLKPYRISVAFETCATYLDLP